MYRLSTSSYSKQRFLLLLFYLTIGYVVLMLIFGTNRSDVAILILTFLFGYIVVVKYLDYYPARKIYLNDGNLCIEILGFTFRYAKNDIRMILRQSTTRFGGDYYTVSVKKIGTAYPLLLWGKVTLIVDNDFNKVEVDVMKIENTFNINCNKLLQ